MVVALVLVAHVWAAVAMPDAAQAVTAPAPPVVTPATLAASSDAELRRTLAALEQHARVTGAELLAAEARRSQIDGERTAAQALLAQWLADAYRAGSTETGGMMVTVLGGGGVQGAVDRIRAARAISDYHARIVQTLDDSEAALQFSAIDRATLIHDLDVTQGRAQLVRAEQGRRAVLAGERRQRVRDAAARAAQRRSHTNALAVASSAAASSGTLVGYRGPMPTLAQIPRGSAPSAAMIDAYLAMKGSPLAGQGGAFVASATRWSVDPRLVVAIAGAESNFGEQTCGPFNAWGWACPNDPADFSDWATGIETITRGLRRGYLDEGRTSVALIQQKYAPSAAANDPTGLNDNWVGNVSKFLLELGGDPARVGPGPIGGVPVLPDLGQLLGD